jgi:hypothetical protein
MDPRMDLRTLFYKTFLSSIGIFFFTIVAFLFLVEYMLRSNRSNSKEGLAQDPLSLVIKSIRSAQKDTRMSESQKESLENALYYAEHIKNL